MPPRKKGKGIVSSGAMSSKASPLPPKATEPLVPLTADELIQQELKRPGYKVRSAYVRALSGRRMLISPAPPCSDPLQTPLTILVRRAPARPSPRPFPNHQGGSQALPMPCALPALRMSAVRSSTGSGPS